MSEVAAGAAGQGSSAEAVAPTSSIDEETRLALAGYLLAWADDELVLGHRDSEWTGVAPQIEEDVAFSSIAQDEMGHAALLYRIAADLTDDDPDRLALRRPATASRHIPLVERPNGDWAHTIARHYLYDLADAVRTDALRDSAYAPLAGAAAKMAREEHYHLMHDAAWWERLRDGTIESHGRLVEAVRVVAPLARDVFGPVPGEEALVAQGIIPRPGALSLVEWRQVVQPLLEALDPALGGLLDGPPSPRGPRPVSAEYADLHREMTMVSLSGLGDRW